MNKKLKAMLNASMRRMNIYSLVVEKEANVENRVLHSYDMLDIRRQLIGMKDKAIQLQSIEHSDYLNGIEMAMMWALGDIDELKLLSPEGKISPAERSEEIGLSNGDIVINKNREYGYIVFDKGPVPGIPSNNHDGWISRLEGSMFLANAAMLGNTPKYISGQYIVKQASDGRHVEYYSATNKDVKIVDFSTGVIVVCRKLRGKAYLTEVESAILASDYNFAVSEKEISDRVAIMVKPAEEEEFDYRNNPINELVRNLISFGLSKDLSSV